MTTPATAGAVMMNGTKQGDHQIARILADLCRPGMLKLP